MQLNTVFFCVLTPRIDLLMNPYFSPVLAELLMGGLVRRAQQSAEVCNASADAAPSRDGDEPSALFGHPGLAAQSVRVPVLPGRISR
jgi:hypothetical protein